MYLVRTPFFFKWLFPKITWSLPHHENKVYLTFDDGPHPEMTPWILDQLKAHQAKATFFCLGRNAEKYPDIIKRILNEGHAIGNHSFSHLNGWKTKDDDYINDIGNAQRYSNTNLFRPPYGRISRAQIKKLTGVDSLISTGVYVQYSTYNIYNWSLMPGDFDLTITSEKCFLNLMDARSGDIICLHDNDQSRNHLYYILPLFLKHTNEFIFDKLP